MNYGRKIESVENVKLSGAIKALDELKSGKICRVDFIKKDGTLRTMNCRTGVRKYATGAGRSWNPADKGLITVYEFGTGYRTVAIDRIVAIKTGGMWHSLNYINKLAQPLSFTPLGLRLRGVRTKKAATSPMYGNK